jgi:hypothetical protein
MALPSKDPVANKPELEHPGPASRYSWSKLGLYLLGAYALAIAARIFGAYLRDAAFDLSATLLDVTVLVSFALIAVLPLPLIERAVRGVSLRNRHWARMALALVTISLGWAAFIAFLAFLRSRGLL